MDFSVLLKNRSILYYPFIRMDFYISDLFGETDSVSSQIITLAPKEERRFPFDVRFDHLGTYQAGLKDMYMKDMLGLFGHQIANDKEYQVVVTPRIYNLENLNISFSSVAESQKLFVPNSMDNTDYSGVREYVIGDPIKNIHWKLSARTIGYMTKTFESYTNTGVCIILDFHAPESDREMLMDMYDAIVETGLSINAYALHNGLETVVRYYSKNGEKAQFSTYQPEDVHTIVADMPKIHTEKTKQDAIQILTEEGNSIYSEGNIVYCTSDITTTLTEALVQIKNRKKNPLLFAVIPDELDDEVREQRKKPLAALDAAGVPYFVLDSAKDLEEGGRLA